LSPSALQVIKQNRPKRLPASLDEWVRKGCMEYAKTLLPELVLIFSVVFIRGP
jgi:hypothetical protein